MNLGTARLRGRPRSSWQDEVREDGRIVGGEGWQETVRNREEWKKHLRTAWNRHILHMPMEIIIIVVVVVVVVVVIIGAMYDVYIYFSHACLM